MKFSEFVIVEKPGVYIDPLGFLKPSRALQDTLFRQFTVLSNHPAYHGALCAIWASLDHAGLRPGAPAYAHRFRELEIFWGVMNAAQGQSVINVNKYKQLLADRVGLRRVAPGHTIYQRLGYGTLGHYSRPSVEWALFSMNGKEMEAAGYRLANAFARRSGMNFVDLLGDWRGGAEFDHTQISEFGEAFHLSATPSPSECTEWQDIITKRMARDPATRALWELPLTAEELAAAEESAEAYNAHQSGLPQRYPALATRLEAINVFERLSGSVQFVFDLHLASLQFRDEAAFTTLSEKDELASAIVALAARAKATGVADAGGLFAALASSPNRYADVLAVVERHHWAHQRAKGVSPYFDDTGLLIKDKVGLDELGTTLESLELAVDAGGRVDLLQFRSRRDWHLHRCRTYHDWAYGVSA